APRVLSPLQAPPVAPDLRASCGKNRACRDNRKRPGMLAPVSRAPTQRKLSAPGQVRIVGGTWRGRKLPVADVEGLRPTPDRVRETLFNWLAPVIDGARCIDLFAGTGALGFEAASRGAAEVWLVERDPRAVQALREAGAKLGGDGISVVVADAIE